MISRLLSPRLRLGEGEIQHRKTRKRKEKRKGREGEREGEACVPVSTQRKHRPGQGVAGNAIFHLS